MAVMAISIIALLVANIFGIICLAENSTGK
jgi:hypothetical protein